MANLTFTPPTDGAAVTMQNGRLCVPDRPIIPFIIGDGTGPEILSLIHISEPTRPY